ncbi:MAG TPA: hypothetical protein DCG19_14505 [Cryomorphaceae bacterium]|nr:hypothetical protein [Owenweeksia sp.]HAD98619.1 hypothetical protein [Cryomorphaceae bacterium]HBF22100.1 hypothetical protein [Cryomorphaceae bacterium]HCQ16306.1 hypothetical protein [Cryomorphaceae bacterium]|tara:strand:+ start:1812 stop:2285 length:474 start_codon:yes stop_codon:yes gene_type:complete
MKKIVVALLTVVSLSTFTSCKSGVTLSQVRSQEDKANSSLQDAHEEMLALAKMKEQYSKDSKEKRLQELRDRADDIQEDIDRLEEVSASNNSAVQANVKTSISSLKNDKADIETQIDAVEKVEKENWASAIETINVSVKNLEEELKKITANLPAEEK